MSSQVYHLDAKQKGIGYRGLLVIVLLLLGYALIAGRLVVLQHGDAAQAAAGQAGLIQGVVTRKPRRGTITDSKGRPLAVSVAVQSCAIDPRMIRRQGLDVAEVIAELRHALHLTESEVATILQRATREGSRFVWVRRLLAGEESEAVAAQKLTGVVLTTEFERRYPMGTLAAHMVGFTDIDSVGREGMEAVCNAMLSGETAKSAIMRDALGRRLAIDGDAWRTDIPGLNVELTLDASIQTIAEQELAKMVAKYKASQGTAVVMDPCTGDVLALACLPTYNPNEPAATEARSRFNFAIGGSYEPGSIFKPFVIGAAIDRGVVTPQMDIFCENGAWRMPENGRVLHDAHGYGWLTAEMVLVKSSNIGTAKIAAMLGKRALYDTVRLYGFGAKTGQPLPGEISATVRPLHKWDTYSMGSVPMGQEIAVTPLQMASAYCPFGNGGMLLKPRMVRRVYAESGEVAYEVPVTPVRRVLSPDTSDRILKMLRKVVTDGTGRRLKIDEYAIGGKTGTAQLPVNQEEIAAGHKGYSPDRYVASFVGIAPTENPRLVVLVSIREPKGGHYGGTVAGPAVREITRRSLRYLGVPQSPEGE